MKGKRKDEICALAARAAQLDSNLLDEPMRIAWQECARILEGEHNPPPPILLV